MVASKGASSVNSACRWAPKTTSLKTLTKGSVPGGRHMDRDRGVGTQTLEKPLLQTKRHHGWMRMEKTMRLSNISSQMVGFFKWGFSSYGLSRIRLKKSPFFFRPNPREEVGLWWVSPVLRIDHPQKGSRISNFSRRQKTSFESLTHPEAWHRVLSLKCFSGPQKEAGSSSGEIFQG